MEFKTCEERILWELDAAENAIAKQDKVIRELNQKLGDLYRLKNLLLKISTYYKYNDLPSVICFNSLYESLDGELYNEFLELVPEINMHEMEMG